MTSQVQIQMIGGRLRKMVFSIAAVSVFLLAVVCAAVAGDSSPQEIIALERAALDRWGKGDVEGFLEIMSEDETYFDPATEKRIDGREALRNYFAPFSGKIRIERVEMIDPKVQRHGDLAVLTFNLIDHGAQLDGGPKSTVRWNCTEVYQRIEGKWKIVHSHWSYIKPELKVGG
jgi:uncharacterized protein (TIGR02246 family)